MSAHGLRVPLYLDATKVPARSTAEWWAEQPFCPYRRSKVTVYSPQVSAVVDYAYQGAEKAKDYAERCEGLTISGRYRSFAKGVFVDTQRGALLSYDGVACLPKCRVTIDFTRGPRPAPLSQVVSRCWDVDSWAKGTEKTFATNPGDLTWEPDSMGIRISFPNTGYEWNGQIGR